MIRVSVEPNVIKPVAMYSQDGITEMTDTIITCIHKKRCESIFRYITKKMNGQEV